MGDLLHRVPLREGQIIATVIRADGSREELGVVSYWHRNPLMRWRYRLLRFLGVM